MEAARPTVRYQKLQDSDSEEPQVTVHLYSRSARWYIREQQRQTCVRIFAALLLLALALAFAFYELNYGGMDKPDSGEDKWASVDDPNWNKTWDNGFGGHQSGHETMTSNHDEEEEADHHHGEEEDSPHHDEEEEAGPHHDEEEEAGHHHEDGEQSDQPAGHTHEHGVYQHATVITASETCSDVGKDILTAGGNVVDAGIAALLCLCVVHPHAAGIGGVFSALYYNSTAGSARALNALHPQSPSGRFGVPLVLQGLRLLHQQYGIMKWSRLFTRPAQLAEEGFHIDGILARALKESEDQVMSSSLRYLFCYTNGSLKEEGVKVTNPQLARVLQAAGSSMKNTSLPESVVENLSEDLLAEGFSPPDTTVYLDSLKSSAMAFESPLSTELDGFRLYAAPPPASGKIIGDILKEINRTKLTTKSADNVQGTVDQYLHILNASKHGYMRGLADSLHSSTDTSSQETLSTKDFARLKFAPVGSHISVADSHGSMILISASLNSSFGSKFSSPSTGILLSDFVANTSSNCFFWACPVVIQHNEEDDVLGVGATGGVSIPSVVAQSIIDHIYFEKPLKDIASGPVLNVNVGEDGAFCTVISGISNTSAVFLNLLDRAVNVTELGTTDMATPVLLVESHAEHVRAFHTPPTCCHFDGF